MALTFDATLKDVGRESPAGFLTAFDRPPTGPVRLLNVDLSTVTTAADLVLGVGDPLEEVLQLNFQASAAAWKHADLLVYNTLLFRHYQVPVHTIIVLLRPEAAHANLNGTIQYAPRPGRGKLEFAFEVERLWLRPAEQLLQADLGVTPLAMLGRLPEQLPLEEGLATVAQRLAERLIRDSRSPCDGRIRYFSDDHRPRTGEAREEIDSDDRRTAARPSGRVRQVPIE